MADRESDQDKKKADDKHTKNLLKNQEDVPAYRNASPSDADPSLGVSSDIAQAQADYQHNVNLYNGRVTPGFEGEQHQRPHFANDHDGVITSRILPEEEGEQGEADYGDGLFGTVMKGISWAWPDELGDGLRGESERAFTSHIPGYKETVGEVMGITLSLGSDLVNTMLWGSDQSDAAMAWTISALPGGINTLDADWEGGLFPTDYTRDNRDEVAGFRGQVTEISTGQTMVSNVGQLNEDYIAPFIRERMTQRQYEHYQNYLRNGITAAKVQEVTGTWMPFDLPNLAFLADGFDHLDEDDKAQAFEQGYGKLLSGATDFVWDIFGDPTIWGGKATSVIRYGGKVGSFAKWGGKTNQSLRTHNHVVGFSKRIDKGLKRHLANGGKGRTTAEFEHVKTLVDYHPAHLTDHIFVKAGNTNDPQAVMRLADMIPPGHYEEGASLVKALAGDASGWQSMKQLNPGLYDEAYRVVTGGGDALLPGAKNGLLNATQTDLGRKLVAQAKQALDEIPDNSVKLAAPTPAGQVITRGGARSGVVADRLAKGADAWRMGKAEGRWGAARKTTYGALEGSASQGGWVTDVIQATSSSRPVMIVRWAGRGRPTNIVHLKGGDGVNANTEIHAWLTHSAIEAKDRTNLFNEFVNAATVEARRNAILKMERAHVGAMAKQNGITPQAAYEAYRSYHSLRNKKVWEVRKTADEMANQRGGTAFAVDENGGLVHVPGIYSELDEAFPLLDTLEFNRVVKANKGGLNALYNGLNRTTEVSDLVNNMWKVSVLLRLGYTARNLTEGALRSAATIGTMAANPKALARVPASLKYRAYRRAKMGSVKAAARATDDALVQMNEARSAINGWAKAAKLDDVAKAQADVKRLQGLARAARRKAKFQPKVKPAQVWDDATRLPVDDAIDDVVRQLDEAKKAFEVAEIKAAGGVSKTAMHGAQKEVNRLTRRLETLNKKRVNDLGKAKAKLTKAEEARFAKETAKSEATAAKRIKEADQLDARLVEAKGLARDLQKGLDDVMPELRKLGGDMEMAARAVDKQLDELARLQAKIAKHLPKRARVGETGNVVGRTAQGDDVVYAGAFQGSEGEMARILSSADNTYAQVFQTGYANRVRALKGADEWIAMDPRLLTTADDWTRYWDNLTVRYNQRYKQDAIIRQWLARGDDEAGLIDDTKKWLMSNKGKNYRETMRTPSGKRLVDRKGKIIEERVDEYIGEMYRRYSSELPQGTGIRQSLAKGQLTPGDVRELWNRRTPPAIPAAVEFDVRSASFFGAAFDKYNSGTGWAMKWLGSLPETNLLRHPYYEAIYRSEQLRMARLAADQGLDINRAAAKAQINTAAHRAALKETRRTMYTIERQSNASNFMRFIAPFFPAWENAIRTWGRIVYQNPAVLGAGNLLWNIPNSLGWVVDEHGNKVDKSNMFNESERNFIVYPEPVLKAMSALNVDLGVVNTGDIIPMLNTLMPPRDENGDPLPVKTRQQGLNVVFPGGVMDMGIGPLFQIPLSLMLRGKPDVTEILRQNTSEDIFTMFVPLGNPNTPVKDMVLPTILKRTVARAFAGEDENTAYLRLKDMMIQDEIVRKEIEGKSVSEEDMKRVLKRADDLWIWSISQAATGFTASSSYNSEWSVERGIWRQLLDDPGLTYSEKIKVFISKVDALHPGKGEDFLVLTRSTTESPFKVNATKTSWDRLTKDETRIEEISRRFGPEYVGQFTNIGDITDPFDQSVYNELVVYDVNGVRAKEKRTPQELKDANDAAEYWQGYFRAKDALDIEAKKQGLPGADSLEQHDELMEAFENVLLEDYPGAEKSLDRGTDWQNQTKKRIKVSRMIVDTAEEYGKKSSTVLALEEYLALREDIVQLRESTDDKTMRKELKAVFDEDVARLRDGDIGFADYYDKYLDKDDLKEVD